MILNNVVKMLTERNCKVIYNASKRTLFKE